jgi:DNA-binding ferritin-like protein (Dps family)
MAENVAEEQKILMNVSRLYANGTISGNEVERLVGKDIAREMVFIRKKSGESVRKGLDYGRWWGEVKRFIY